MWTINHALGPGLTLHQVPVPLVPCDMSPTVRGSRTHMGERIFLNIVSSWGRGSLVHL